MATSETLGQVCVLAGVLGMSEEDGSPEEFEEFKSVAISAAYLPGVDVYPFRLKSGDVSLFPCLFQNRLMKCDSACTVSAVALSPKIV